MYCFIKDIYQTTHYWYSFQKSGRFLRDFPEKEKKFWNGLKMLAGDRALVSEPPGACLIPKATGWKARLIGCPFTFSGREIGCRSWSLDLIFLKESSSVPRGECFFQLVPLVNPLTGLMAVLTRFSLPTISSLSFLRKPSQLSTSGLVYSLKWMILLPDEWTRTYVFFFSP